MSPSDNTYQLQVQAKSKRIKEALAIYQRQIKELELYIQNKQDAKKLAQVKHEIEKFIKK